MHKAEYAVPNLKHTDVGHSFLHVSEVVRPVVPYHMDHLIGIHHSGDYGDNENDEDDGFKDPAHHCHSTR